MSNQICRRNFLRIAAASAGVPAVLGIPASDSPALPAGAPLEIAPDPPRPNAETELPVKKGGIQEAGEIAQLSKIGKGNYVRPRLRKQGEVRELKYDSHFEETAPGRNSASNEWSAYGVTGGNNAFNCMGRDMCVRYPAYDLVFRIYEEAKEVCPGDLDSFRLGLVRDKLPAIWGRWEYGGAVYEVSVMAVPSDTKGNAFDLYKIVIQNPTQTPIQSKLVVGLDGPPDMRLEGDVLRGLGDAPFLLADPPQNSWLLTRDWGLEDKRAKSYDRDGVPDAYDPAFGSTRIGLDGLPVVYRIRAGKDEHYTIYVGAIPFINKLLPQPQKAGDLIFKYEVEGAAPQTVDWIEYSGKQPPPICLRFDGARDTNGDGYIQIRAGNAENSRLKHTRLSAIYVFPSGITIKDKAAVYSGSMNKQCVRFIDVGCTPEEDSRNQLYDKSDVGLCRFHLSYGGRMAPGENRTYWLKVPPIHRRQPASMGAISHAFQQVLPGEAVPPFGPEKVAELREWAPDKAENSVIDLWENFFVRIAQIETPDPVLKDIYLSRLATRAIHDIRINDEVWFNTCSPWFYHDFSYRDQCYQAIAYDLAGLHDLSARLLRQYCMDVKDVPKGPICFLDEPLQLGMFPDGMWLTRPGQYDAQGQNLWALVQHYKLSGGRRWLAQVAYPYIKRGAMWIVNSRHKHMEEVGDPNDPRYGLIQPGAMEIWDPKKGMHHYYMDAWAILGLREAAEAANALGLVPDQNLFAQECRDLKMSLYKSFQQTFRRTGLYEGQLWYGVEEQGVGMYGDWGHTPLVWPTGAIEPHDPMLTATFRRMERMANQWGGGLYSDDADSCWPYISVDWAISYILRGEPEKTLDFFCAFTDTAGLTYSWGEGYTNKQNIANGDQPHSWADAMWLGLFRRLFVMEDGPTLLLTPATFRRWQQGDKQVRLSKLPTEFGELDLTIEPRPDANLIDYRFKLTPVGDQGNRNLEKIVVNARAPQGRKVTAVQINGQAHEHFTNDLVLIPHPGREKEYRLKISLASY
jgi:hypothetical protein